MLINRNMSWLNIYNNLTAINKRQAIAMERLSSGLRINRPADDPAGFVISEKMRAQIRGLKQAERNAQDTISMLQVAEGALNETHEILQRIRELSVQAANGTNSDAERAAIQVEVEELLKEINRISGDTEFNERKLLNGSSGVSGFDGSIVGNVNVSSDTKHGTYLIDVTSGPAQLAGSATTGALGTNCERSDTVGSGGTLTINGVSINVGTTDIYEVLAQKINNSVNGVIAEFDANNQLIIRTNDIGATAELNIRESNAGILNDGNDWTTVHTTNGTNASGVVAANFGAGATLSYKGNKVTVLGGDANGLTFELKSIEQNTSITVNGSLSFQIGANEGQDISISFSNASARALGIENIDLSTQEGAKAALSKIDDAIKIVSKERSRYGAMQNRLEHTINNLNTSIENLTAAESRIRDADMAKEMMEYTKSTIIQQAAQAMLAQAMRNEREGMLRLLDSMK